MAQPTLFHMKQTLNRMWRFDVDGESIRSAYYSYHSEVRRYCLGASITRGRIIFLRPKSVNLGPWDICFENALEVLGLF